MSATTEPAPEDGLQTVQRACGIVILTGAGVTADSGIPTFRDPDGLWSQYRPEELATPQAFARNPKTVWGWYEWRRRAVADCDPNEGHRAIARFLLSRTDVVLVTQNVDGLHQRALDEVANASSARSDVAGDADDRILELHGSLLRNRCSECGRASSEWKSGDNGGDGPLPHCVACGAMMRPDVVWFGEPLDDGILDRAFDEARAAEVCIGAGTSAIVHPAASVPLATREAGGIIIEVNPEETPITALSQWSLRGSSAEVLPQLLG